MRKTLTAVASAAALTVGLGAPAASADEAGATTPVTESQVDTSDNTGTVRFLGDGVYLRTRDWSQEATGWYDVDQTTSGVASIGMDWNGTSDPGMWLAVDLGHTDETGEPDGVVDGYIAYEPVYGGNLWASGKSSDEFKALAPNTAPGNGNNEGQGSQWYGTWEEWRTSFPTNTEITKAGFLLAVPGRGTLLSQTIGDTTYTFSEDAPLPVARPKVKWAQDINVTKRFVKFNVEARQPNGTQSTKRGAYYKVVIHNPRTDRTRFAGSGRVTEGDSDRVKVNPSAYLPRAKKALRVRVISYGDRRSNVKFVPTKRSRKHAKVDHSRMGWD